MPTTLADLAEALGVSKMTVSRAINNHPAIHRNTRERVLMMAQQMNYRPNQYARALATKRSYLIGLIVPDLMHSYYAEIAKAIEGVVRPTGYEILICNTNEDAAHELAEVEALRHRTDGLIIASAVTPSKITAYRKMLSEGAKITLLDRRFENLCCPIVTTDDLRVGVMATEHLIKLGHRRIGHLRGPDVTVARDRLTGYQQALAAHGLRFEESLVRDCGFFETGGYEVMQAWIKQKKLPSALFAANDPAAIGALKALLEAGIRVPQDIALVGAGNIHYADLLSVPLTTVTWDKTQMGQQAAQLLLNLLAENKNGAKKSKPQQIIIDPQLVIRKSCGASL